MIRAVCGRSNGHLLADVPCAVAPIAINFYRDSFAFPFDAVDASRPARTGHAVIARKTVTRVFHDEFHVRDIRVLNNDGDRAGRERRQRELKEARAWSREGR